MLLDNAVAERSDTTESVLLVGVEVGGASGPAIEDMSGELLGSLLPGLGLLPPLEPTAGTEFPPPSLLGGDAGPVGWGGSGAEEGEGFRSGGITFGTGAIGTGRILGTGTLGGGEASVAGTLDCGAVGALFP